MTVPGAHICLAGRGPLRAPATGRGGVPRCRGPFLPLSGGVMPCLAGLLRAFERKPGAAVREAASHHPSAAAWKADTVPLTWQESACFAATAAGNGRSRNNPDVAIGSLSDSRQGLRRPTGNSRSSARPALDPSRPAPGPVSGLFPVGPCPGATASGAFAGSFGVRIENDRSRPGESRAGYRAARINAATRPGGTWSVFIQRALPQSDGRPAPAGRSRLERRM